MCSVALGSSLRWRILSSIPLLDGWDSTPEHRVVLVALSGVAPGRLANWPCTKACPVATSARNARRCLWLTSDD
eukprot:6417021-Alexandrium_andersonii.AAC.1